jgi:hypothetical protein
MFTILEQQITPSRNPPINSDSIGRRSGQQGNQLQANSLTDLDSKENIHKKTLIQI